MSKTLISTVVVTPLIAAVLPAAAQQVQPAFPDGPGKQILTQLTIDTGKAAAFNGREAIQ